MQRNIKSGRGVSKGFFGDVLGAGAQALGGLASMAGEAVGGLVGSRFGGVPGAILGAAAGGAVGEGVKQGAGALAGGLRGLPFQKGGIIGGGYGVTTPYKMNPFTGRMEPSYGGMAGPMVMYRKGGVVRKVKKAKKAKKAKK